MELFLFFPKLGNLIIKNIYIGLGSAVTGEM